MITSLRIDARDAADRLDTALIDRALSAARSIETSLAWHRARDRSPAGLRAAAERALVVAAADTWYGEPRVRLAAVLDAAGRLLATTDQHAFAGLARMLPGEPRAGRADAPFEVIALDRRALERWMIRVPLACEGESLGALWIAACRFTDLRGAAAPALQLV